ncbi:GntR family transcriptional regulator [Collinsella vaginalis]|uniref:GntR family transcriptional regulator n=1 Tax=Collinsella vaginalis TaxID=1870987 RepID=UPI000A26D987|nr:GntR family transcriptional regulator [Collinsella vaginalis]
MPRSSLKDNVYAYISSLIDRNELSAGDRVSEQAICSEMDVSRTPVREALIQLAAEGYLDNEPNKGFRVRGFDRQNAEEVFEIMGALDGQAAFLACPRLDDDTLNQMRFLVGSMDLALENGLVRRYDDIQRDFHNTYVESCGNERLKSLIAQSSRCFIKKEYETVDRAAACELLRKANDEHREILRLFEHGDATGVRRYIRDVHWNIENAQFTVW